MLISISDVKLLPWLWAAGQSESLVSIGLHNDNFLEAWNLESQIQVAEREELKKKEEFL